MYLCSMRLSEGMMMSKLTHLVLVLGAPRVDGGCLQPVHPGRHSAHARPCLIELRDPPSLRHFAPHCFEKPSFPDIDAIGPLEPTTRGKFRGYYAIVHSATIASINSYYSGPRVATIYPTCTPCSSRGASAVAVTILDHSGT